MKTFSLSLLLALIIGQAAAFVVGPNQAANKVAIKEDESSTSLAYGYYGGYGRGYGSYYSPSYGGNDSWYERDRYNNYNYNNYYGGRGYGGYGGYGGVSE